MTGTRHGGQRLLTVLRAGLRWKPRSYWHIWLTAATLYVTCVVVLTLIGGRPKSDDFYYAATAVTWIALAARQSYNLNCRRNVIGPSEGRLPRQPR
jgi:hypothetical protein